MPKPSSTVQHDGYFSGLQHLPHASGRLGEVRREERPKFNVLGPALKKATLVRRVDVWSAAHGRACLPNQPPRPETPYPRSAPTTLRPHELECINPAFFVEATLQQEPVAGTSYSAAAARKRAGKNGFSDGAIFSGEDTVYQPTAALLRQLLKAVNAPPPRLHLPVPEMAARSSLAPPTVRLETAVAFCHPPERRGSPRSQQEQTWPLADGNWPRVAQQVAQRAFERQLQVWGPSPWARHVNAPGANFEFLDLATAGGFRRSAREVGRVAPAATDPVSAQLLAMQALLARLVAVATTPAASSVPMDLFTAEVATLRQEAQEGLRREREAAAAAREAQRTLHETQQRLAAENLQASEERLRRGAAEARQRQDATLRQHFDQRLQAQRVELRTAGQRALRAQTQRLRSEAAATRRADAERWRAGAEARQRVRPPMAGDDARAGRLDDSRLRRNLPEWLSTIAAEPYFVHLRRGLWDAPGWQNTLFAVPKASLSVTVWWFDKVAAVVAWLHASGMLSLINMALSIYLRSPRVA